MPFKAFSSHSINRPKQSFIEVPSDNQNEVCTLLKSTHFCVLLYENKTYSL